MDNSCSAREVREATCLKLARLSDPWESTARSVLLHACVGAAIRPLAVRRVTGKHQSLLFIRVARLADFKAVARARGQPS